MHHRHDRARSPVFVGFFLPQRGVHSRNVVGLESCVISVSKDYSVEHGVVCATKKETKSRGETGGENDGDEKMVCEEKRKRFIFAEGSLPLP